MKKVALTLLTVFLISCSSSSLKTTEIRPLFEVLIQPENGGATIRFFEILSEPKEIRMLQNDDKLKHKIHSEDIQNSNFIVLNMGEKPTGGYQIGVENVVETDQNIIVTVKETVPDTTTMVSQVVTTPYCVVRINSKKEIIIN